MEDDPGKTLSTGRVIGCEQHGCPIEYLLVGERISKQKQYDKIHEFLLEFLLKLTEQSANHMTPAGDPERIAKCHEPRESRRDPNRRPTIRPDHGKPRR